MDGRVVKTGLKENEGGLAARMLKTGYEDLDRVTLERKLVDAEIEIEELEETIKQLREEKWKKVETIKHLRQVLKDTLEDDILSLR